MSIHEGLAERQEVVLYCFSPGSRDWRVNTERFPDDRVEVRQRVQLVHGWIVSADAQQLLAKFPLRLWILRERKQRPRSRGAVPGYRYEQRPMKWLKLSMDAPCRFVSSDHKGRDF